jgi:hypothetical protein
LARNSSLSALHIANQSKLDLRISQNTLDSQLVKAHPWVPSAAAVLQASVAERPVVLSPYGQGEARMLQYLRNSPGVFSPETVDVMASALDQAWELFKTSGPHIDGQAEVARTALAEHIIDMVKQGERDRQRLIEGALLRLKL